MTDASPCPGHSPGIRFRLPMPGGYTVKCLRHAMIHRRLIRTAIPTALVVGTILTAINQGNILLEGSFPGTLYWKIPLTYCVPYGVSTWSQLYLTFVRAPAKD
jgi:hypothetical protein